MESNGDRLSGFLKLYTNYAAAGLLGFVYLAVSVVRMDATGRTLPQILSDSFLVFIVGICVSSVFRQNGLKLGRAEAEVMEAVSRHEAVAAAVAPRVTELSLWCAEETARVLRTERMRVLADECMRYEDCFDEQGRPIPYEPRYIEKRPFERGFWRAMQFNRLETRRARAAIRAARLRIRPLRAGELLSEGHSLGDPFHMGRSREEFVREGRWRDIATKTMISLVFGYYGVSMLEDFRPEVLLWRIFQVILMGVFGLMTQAAAMDYMRDEFRARMISKASYLHQFQAQGGGEGAPVAAVGAKAGDRPSKEEEHESNQQGQEEHVAADDRGGYQSIQAGAGHGTRAEGGHGAGERDAGPPAGVQHAGGVL